VEGVVIYIYSLMLVCYFMKPVSAHFLFMSGRGRGRGRGGVLCLPGAQGDLCVFGPPRGS